MKRAGKLPANAAALKTIVTTEMARAVAEANGLDLSLIHISQAYHALPSVSSRF